MRRASRSGALLRAARPAPIARTAARDLHISFGNLVCNRGNRGLLRFR